MNGTLGSVSSPSIGPVGAAIEDLPGKEFRLFCEDNGMIVPSTMPLMHKALAHRTWTNKAGHAKRIEYFALPKSSRISNISADIDEDLDIIIATRDRFPLRLSFRLSHGDTDPLVKRRQAICSRSATKIPESVNVFKQYLGRGR